MYLSQHIDNVLESKKNKLVGTVGYYKFISILNKSFNSKDLKFKFESFSDIEEDYYTVSGLYDMAKDVRYVILNFSDRKIDFNLTEECWNSFKFFISQVIQHETIHQNQWMQRDEVVEPVECDFKILFGSSSKEEEMDYLSDPEEIDAYAHDIAMEIKFFYKQKDPYDVLRNINKLRKIPSYSIYKKAFRGCDWNDIKKSLLLKTYKWIPYA